jgi:pyruvate dehydrogenase E1 component alpha subunit
VGQGAFHEAVNLASLYKLPVVYVIENNQYAMGTSVSRAFAETDFYKQALGYNMHGAVVDGMDVLDVYHAMTEQVAMARDFEPSILEIRTYRYRGHSMSDPGNYRTKEELDAKKGDDPIIRLKAYIIENDLSTNDALDKVDESVKKEVMEAVAFADENPLPELDEIYDNVYAQKDYPFLS